ncbi:MAG TPA: hypothetical protein PKJ77_08370, partial [Thermodesulfobacteriota bacterium]|nr:hypothetical protein [Thermodesulfobacteriota bacterium]
ICIQLSGFLGSWQDIEKAHSPVGRILPEAHPPKPLSTPGGETDELVLLLTLACELPTSDCRLWS